MAKQKAQTFLDLNAAAGGLREIFVLDVTTATCQCGHCGKTGPFAEMYVYATEPGLVVRCNSCENVLMRAVTAPNRVWLDLRGMTFLEMPMKA